MRPASLTCLAQHVRLLVCGRRQGPWIMAFYARFRDGPKVRVLLEHGASKWDESLTARITEAVRGNTPAWKQGIRV